MHAFKCNCIVHFQISKSIITRYIGTTLCLKENRPKSRVQYQPGKISYQGKVVKTTTGGEVHQEITHSGENPKRFWRETLMKKGRYVRVPKDQSIPGEVDNLIGNKQYKWQLKQYVDNLEFYTSPPDKPEQPAVKKQAESALYICDNDTVNMTVVNLDLDLDNRFGKTYEDINKLQQNLDFRNIKDINIQELLDAVNAMDLVKSKHAILIKEREEIEQRMREITAGDDIEEITIGHRNELALRHRGKELRQILKTMKKEWGFLESFLMLKALKLPVDIHSETPPENTDLQTNIKPKEFSFSPKSHALLAQRNSNLVFSDLNKNAYYLRSELANFELDLMTSCNEQLRSKGYDQFSLPDMVKSLVVEACGYDFKDKNKVLQIAHSHQEVKDFVKKYQCDAWEIDKWDITLHLTGVSLMGFAAYFTKLNLHSDDIPHKCFASGRSYFQDLNTATTQDLISNVNTSDSSKDLGLLNITQSSNTELFTVSPSSEIAHQVFEEYRDLIWDFYLQFNIPIKMVNCGYSYLRRSESRRSDLMAWFPSLNRYERISEVSVKEDFISRRLMIKHDRNISKIHNSNYTYTTHSTFLSIPRLLAAIIENNQKEDGTYSLDNSSFRI